MGVQPTCSGTQNEIEQAATHAVSDVSCILTGKWCDAAIVDVNSWDLRQDGHCDKVMTDATVQLYPAGFCVREELRGAISWAMTS